VWQFAFVIPAEQARQAEIARSDVEIMHRNLQGAAEDQQRRIELREHLRAYIAPGATWEAQRDAKFPIDEVAAEMSRHFFKAGEELRAAGLEARTEDISQTRALLEASPPKDRAELERLHMLFVEDVRRALEGML
jgi:hypothetical protein